MPSFLFDIVFVSIFGFTTWFVGRKLLIETVAISLAVVLSSLFAIATFEPLGNLCRRTLFAPTDIAVTKWLWFLFAFGIFVLTFLVLLQTFYRCMGETRQYGRLAESFGCWLIGGFTGYALAAFAVTILQTLPMSRDFGGALAAEAHLRHTPVMATAPDYQFLTFAEYVCAPRSPFAGTPWQPRGPMFSTEVTAGQWAGFPARYALWREWLELAENVDAEMSKSRARSKQKSVRRNF